MQRYCFIALILAFTPMAWGEGRYGDAAASPSTSGLSNPFAESEGSGSRFEIKPLTKQKSPSGRRQSPTARTSGLQTPPAKSSRPLARTSPLTARPSSPTRTYGTQGTGSTQKKGRSVTPPVATYTNSRTGANNRTGSSSLQTPLRSSQQTSAESSRRETATHAMLTKMLKPPRDSRLSGTPTGLASVVAVGGSRERQSQLVDAYWALSSAATDYYLGLHEADELERLKQRVPTFSTALSEAITSHNTRVDTSLKAARAAQIRLTRIMGNGSQPLPTDTPFCGPYATRFNEIFTGGGPEEARLLSELIPLRLGELEEAVGSVQRSEEWLGKVAADQRSGSQGTGMIRALELLALNRRALVMITRDYNLQINRYAQLASPGNVQSDRLVAMLLRAPGRNGTFATGQSYNRGRSAELEFRPGAAASRR